MRYSIKYISPTALSRPKGHYSPGVIFSGLVFVSGQLPDATDASFADQVKSALEKIRLVLEEATCGFSDLLKVTAYIDGIDRWEEFNTVYREVLGDARPARAIVPVSGLHHGALVEIEAIAASRGGLGTT